MLAELGIEHLGLFVLSGWLLNLTPGPDVLYIVSSALRSGVRAGIVAALGITAGCFVHIVAAGLGVSALMATSAMAFSVLKWVGGGLLALRGCAAAPVQGAGCYQNRSGQRRFCGGWRPKIFVFQGLLDERTQPQSGAVLPGLCAAVHYAGRSPSHGGFSVAGGAVQSQRHPDQYRLCRPGGLGRAANRCDPEGHALAGPAGRRLVCRFRN